MPRFPGASFPLSAGGPDAFPASVMRFPSPRLMFSGSRAFAFPARSLPFSQGCLFVRCYPGGPAYVSCTRYTSRLAGGCRPLDPCRSQRPKP
jgi:hypothetical protein